MDPAQTPEPDNGYMHTFLETDRLTLRRFTEDDVDNLFDLNGDPAVMRYLTGGKPTPREQIRDEIIPFHLGIYQRTDEFGTWAAQDRRSGEFLGWFHFRPGPSEGTDLGYRLRRAVWGKGYATEGSRALIRKGFTELGVRRVFALTMTVNAASRRVLEKSGLILVRTFDYDGPDPIAGSEHGEVEYELTRPQWEARASLSLDGQPVGRPGAIRVGRPGAIRGVRLVGRPGAIRGRSGEAGHRLGQLDTVPSLPFRQVECRVGEPLEPVERARVVREARDADGGRHGHVGTGEGDLRDRRPDALGDCDRREDLGVGEKDRELLSAIAAGEVLAPQRGPQHRPDARQDLIPYGMSPLVVDLLKVVEVEQQQRKRRPRRRGLREHPLQRVRDGSLVGQSGETVGRGADLRDG
jgi:RimJ/RimL family protein N-acetyltransferase